jgi:hypothetical protein
MLGFSARGGTVAVITLQHWLSTISYKEFRKRLLSGATLDFLSYVGPGAFETIKKVNITFSVATASAPVVEHEVAVLDVGSSVSPTDKSAALLSKDIVSVRQTDQLANLAHTLFLNAQQKFRKRLGNMLIA